MQYLDTIPKMTEWSLFPGQTIQYHRNKSASQPLILKKLKLNSSMKTYREKAMAPHSSILAWKIPWMEEPHALQSMGLPQLDTTEKLHYPFSLSCIGEGNGNPLQCSCLENSRDSGAWWAAIYGVAQSQTWLKWLNPQHEDLQDLLELISKKDVLFIIGD